MSLVTVAWSCRGEPPREADTGAHAASLPWTGEWSAELGDMLVVPAEGENVGIIIYPEQERVAAMPAPRITLVSRGGDSAIVESAVIRDSVECDVPLVRIRSAVPITWSAGFVGLGSRPVRADSISGLSQPDSLGLADALIALVAAIPTPAQSRFRDIPFGLMTARRIETDDREIITAQLVRRIGQEAQPLEERTFIVVSRPPGSSAPRLLHFERSEGLEDAVTHYELLAVLRGGQAPVLLIARDSPTTPAYALLEVLGDTLRERWTRRLACGN